VVSCIWMGMYELSGPLSDAVSPETVDRPERVDRAESFDRPVESQRLVTTFDELYRRTFAPMVRLAYVLVDTDEQAEEVVQDAFAALYVRWHKVTDPEAYLRTSVLNGARAVLRRRRVLRRRAHELHVVDAEEDAGATRSGQIVDIVRRLPARQRAVVVLRYEMQLSEAEIAHTLDIPVGTVKSNLHRALARLRQEVTP
jgi:RNA polymerase sigma-70 factor (sigma-E family)